MQGIGRSSGNASTEKLISIMSRMGLGLDYDVIQVLKAGEDYIRPLIPYAGHSGLDTMAGYALFHTSYMDNLLKACEEFDADP
jgi:4-hydroxy 2-oxovalerate aldolase/long-chain acyl-CoA synthetase